MVRDILEAYRHLFACVLKSQVCKCGCRGACTMNAIYRILCWTCNAGNRARCFGSQFLRRYQRANGPIWWVLGRPELKDKTGTRKTTREKKHGLHSGASGTWPSVQHNGQSFSGWRLDFAGKAYGPGRFAVVEYRGDWAE